MICNTYYAGGFRTRTFADIFPSFEEFQAEYNSTALKITFNEYLSLDHLYYMLYAHYGNSHISMSDENQFKYYMYSIIYQHGPATIKKRELQMKLTSLSDEEIKVGGTAIYNHAFNPSTNPSTQTMYELMHINDQNVTKYSKSLVEAYSYLNEILSRDVVDEFIHKFQRLFIKITATDYPLTYVTEDEND